MAYILHLETATKVCSVALSNDGKLIQQKEIEEDGYSHGENLTLFIEAVVQAAGITMKNLSAVSVASGPGSYTGLRIGVATAKGICYALKIPLIAVDALTSLCEIAREQHPGKTLCAMIDARRMEVYSMIQSPENDLLKPTSADILDETSYQEFSPFVYFGDGAPKLQDVWTDYDRVADVEIKCSARGQVALAHDAFQNNNFEDVAYFEPFYLKDFIAGVKKA